MIKHNSKMINSEIVEIKFNETFSPIYSGEILEIVCRSYGQLITYHFLNGKVSNVRLSNIDDANPWNGATDESSNYDIKGNLIKGK